MPLLRFKTVFHEAIRRGAKTTTLRRWSRPMVKAGVKALAPHVGVLYIEHVERVELAKLTAADAKADGFDSLEELCAAVRKIYPNASGDGKEWYRIRFHLAEGPGGVRVRAGRPGKGKARSEDCRFRRGDRARLAAAIRAELDKAVSQTRS